MTSSTSIVGRSARQAGRKRFSGLLAVSLLALAAACSSPEQKVERYSADAAKFLAEGDLSRAYIQYQNVLKIDEEHVPTLVGLADIAEQRQDFSAMFGFLQRIVRLDPSRADAHIKLGKLYMIGSDETAALESAEKALALEPDNLDARSLKAGVLLKVGDSGGAVELARGVLEKDPKNSEAVTVLVTNYSMKGDNEAALAELNRALDLNPQVSILQLLRIHILTTLGRTDDVNDAYAELIELFPDEPAYRRVYANNLIQRRDFAAAREQLEAVVAQEPENHEAKLDVVRIVNASESRAAAEAKLLDYIKGAPADTRLKFALSDFYIQSGETDKAMATLDGLAASSEQDVAMKAKNKIAGVKLTGDDREGAVKLIDEILATDEQNTDALIKRAAIQIEAKDYDQAIVNLRTALNSSPDSYEAMILMSAAFEQQNNFSFAQAELAKAYDASKRAANVANQFALFLIRRDNRDRAEEVLVDSLAAHPGNVDNLQLLASIRLAKQDWRGAEEVAGLLEKTGDRSALASNIKSAAYVGLQDFNSVIETLEARSETAPLETRPLAALVAAYIREKRTDDAEALLLRILETDADNYAARVLLGQVYSSAGEQDKFEAAMIAATESHPDQAEAYEILYRSYLGAGRQDDAAALIERGLAAAPENEALRVFKADVLLFEGKREAALEIYSDLISTRPNDRIIANNFVSLSSDLRLDEASVARALEVAKSIESIENPYFRDTVGWAYYRAGDNEKALTYLTEAAAGAENSSDIFYHLGAVQLASGDKAAAKVSLEKALKNAEAGNFLFGNEVRALLDRM